MADWEDVKDPAEIRKVLGAKRADKAAGAGTVDKQAQMFLNKLSTEAQSAAEVGRLYDRAEGALKKVKPGPYRNRLLLSPAIPEDNGGILDAISGATLGGVARAIGAVTPEEVSAYQTVRGIQSGGVLEKQLAQKGPQTESDAARLMLTEISPGKDAAANDEIIRAGRQKIKRDQAKATFYTKWANKYGLNGTNPEGETADQIWARSSDYIVKKLDQQAGHGKVPSQIRVISRTKVQ